MNGYNAFLITHAMTKTGLRLYQNNLDNLIPTYENRTSQSTIQCT